MELDSDHHGHEYLLGDMNSCSHPWFAVYIVPNVPPARRAGPSVPIPVCHDCVVTRWPRGENQQGGWGAGRYGETCAMGSWGKSEWSGSQNRSSEVKTQMKAMKDKKACWQQ